ncbi:hypothetical protein [Tissierella sp.]|uniref:hypothetical protein n=1 Tax=Tissierella sp. TaxID=41274 RepID=UPI0028B0EC8D|nr:hypothetical protein [Tissierella sp.]
MDLLDELDIEPINSYISWDEFLFRLKNIEDRIKSANKDYKPLFIEVYNSILVMNKVTNYEFTEPVTGENIDFNVPIQEHTYPLPDPNISITDRNSYGYLDDEMLPL